VPAPLRTPKNSLNSPSSLGRESRAPSPIIDAKIGEFSASWRFRRQLPCYTFSQITEEPVYDTGNDGLKMINVTGRFNVALNAPPSHRSICLETVKRCRGNKHCGFRYSIVKPGRGSCHISTTYSSQSLFHPFDKSRTAAIVPTGRGRVVLLEPVATTISWQVFTILLRKIFSSIPIMDRTSGQTVMRWWYSKGWCLARDLPYRSGRKVCPCSGCARWKTPDGGGGIPGLDPPAISHPARKTYFASITTLPVLSTLSESPACLGCTAH